MPSSMKVARTLQDSSDERPCVEGVVETRKKLCSPVTVKRIQLRRSTFWKPGQILRVDACVCAHVALVTSSWSKDLWTWSMPMWSTFLPPLKGPEPISYCTVCLEINPQPVNHKKTPLSLLGGKLGHTSEGKVYQSPHPNKQTQMCVKASQCTALNWGLIRTYFGELHWSYWVNETISAGPQGKRSRKRKPGTKQCYNPLRHRTQEMKNWISWLVRELCLHCRSACVCTMWKEVNNMLT